MTSYRDDLKAARSRISLLETELEDREEEIDALLGPDAADVRRRAKRSRDEPEDFTERYREAKSLEQLRVDEERHHTRVQRLACLGIAAGIVALALGTFYLVFALIRYAAA